MIVARRMLADHRRSFIWWAVAMVAIDGLTVGLWPSIRGEEQFDELIRELPDALRGLFGAGEGVSFISPPGYLHSRLFSLLFPVLLVVFGIGVAARAVGASEESGTLELVLAYPVPRARVVVERYLSMVTLVLGLAAVAVIALVVLAPLVGLLDGVSLVRVAGASAAAASLALLYASLAFAAGCVTGRRGSAIGVAGAAAVGGYVLQGLIAAAEVFAPARFLSPWHWYLDRNLLVAAPGFQAVMLPLILAALVSLAAMLVFLRRDLRLP